MKSILDFRLSIFDLRVAAVGLLVGLIGSGCASQSANATRQQMNQAVGAAATTQPLDAQAMLSLDQIQPKIALPALRKPATTAPAPLDAIELYAHARDEILQNHVYTAINLLEKAIALDPNSFELQFALGRAYIGVQTGFDRGIAALQKAAEINPDDLELQTELGRAYLAHNDLPKAIERFRMAMLTSDYRTDDGLAATVDYRLATSLEQQGYSKAALECYLSLLNRLEHPDTSAQVTPEINYLMNRPELLYEEIGKLSEKLGDYATALKSYQHVADAQPADFDLQARVVQTLLKMGRRKESIETAASLVRKFHASAASIDLLKDVYQNSGSQKGAFLDALRTLYKEHSSDRAILFALADTLAGAGQLDQARDLLNKGIEVHHGDVEVVQRLYDLYSQRDQVVEAAKLIVRVSAAYPDVTSELDPLFVDLLRLSRKNSLRLTTFQKIDVPASSEPAKQYWVWRLASIWGRPTAAKVALEQASAANPPFDPACRAQINTYLSRSDLDSDAQKKACDALIDRVKSHGRADLAAELRGLMLMQKQPAQAAQAFADAIQLTPSPRTASPNLQLNYAYSILMAGDAPRFEQLMSKLLADHPRFADAYRLMLEYFRQNSADNQAWALDNTWLAADPNSVAARLEQVKSLIEQRRGDEALAAMKRLFAQHPDDSDVVGSLVILMRAANQLQPCIDLLEAERAKHPGNRIAVEALLDIYAGQRQLDKAQHVIDAARAAVADDPDLLYYVAHLYERIDQPQTTEQVLQDVIKLDPNNPQAGNDLGYTWADEGKNIDRAESLIRMAVNAEPDNPSYLDSLGWVLYKRSRFTEALKLLQQASEPLQSADPVVLNHLGDALYRLHRAADAQAAWQQSLAGIENTGSPRDELVKLRLELQTKLREAAAGENVDVAPVVDAPPGHNDQQAMRGLELFGGPTGARSATRT